MAENKFIKHLKGEQAVGSLVEIKNQNTPASFGNMPQGTSDSNVKYSDVRGDVTVVANGTTAWKLNDSALTLAPIVNGDGTDYISNYAVSGAGLWVNSTYTFPSTGDPNHPVAMIFNPNSKWVLKLCGDNLIVNDGNTLELTVVITIGSSNIISKQFTVREQATHFCKELVIDFDESNSALIKASGLSTMQLQVLCGTADASARIYNGMTTLTVLQRKVDAAVVSGTFANVEEVLRDGLLPNDYFSNAAYIAQITDGDTAYAVFQRDGDDVALAGWAQPIPDQTNNAGKFLTTDGSLMSWAQLTISDVDGLSTELSDLQDQIDDLSGRGRYLSIWNCTTGLAESNPPESPYTYQSGDYFIVGTVGATNYKPDGSSYTTGVASTTVETAEVKVDDLYLYDGTNWKLLASSQRTYTFAGIAGSPYDNTNLGNALNAKVDANAAISGATKCKITYDNKGLVTAGADLVESDIPSLHLSKISDVTASASEVNVLDGITASTTELNYVDGVTSAIQTQIDGKQPKSASAYNMGNTSGGWTAMSNTQQDALNSGANTTNIGQIATNTSNIANEIIDRQNADNGLQSQIDAIVSKSDVVDIVGTYAELQAYDTSGLGNNDVVKVISDSTHNNAPSYYRWVITGGVGAWVYIGSESETYTKAETDALLNAKQDNITATDGITLTGTTLTNSGVRAVASGTANGTISVNTNGTSADVAVTGLGSAAYTNSSAYATAAQGTKADTAVQPGDLATVATTGDYDDLLNKPTIPTVNNATITITQGGVTKGSFTLNQATDDTIALDAGGGGSSYHPDLFDHKWADHICNDVQWLRADTYSWQSGAVYQVAYQHLADDIDGKTLQSETIGSTTIQFYLADDGHKICPASEESNVTAIYNATGVGWYYIIDTANTRFKLPRSKHNKYADNLNVAGNGMTLGLSDGTNSLGLQAANTANYGAINARSDIFGKNVGWNSGQSAYSSVVHAGLGVTTDSSKSGMVAQQEQDTDQYKYLYFYVGNFTQTALENTAGITTEEMNNKVNIGHEVIEFQAPTAQNNYTWYRKYADGWVEQGGKQTGSVSISLGSAGSLGTITLPVEMKDANYYANAVCTTYCMLGNVGKTETTVGFQFMPYQAARSLTTVFWEIKGMAA